jgi:hypothetical protein
MDTSDINPTASPEAERCTAHLFEPDKRDYLGDNTLPLGSPLRICTDRTRWPPAILFDAVYASAVLHHFGTKTMKDEVTGTWKNIFYPGGAITTTKADLNAITEQRAADVERKQQNDQDCHVQQDALDGPDTFDMLTVLPYIRVPRNGVQAMLRGAEEAAEAAEQRRVHEKVDSWMKQITPA